ncbi:hypothetical protein ACJIZ3_011446 [Penstemon smallii]|uniref:Uncharacterized protein n=1 Tax=Penstemon smallii TaxID=265156 RepID=A0ABD3UJ57_9LAMI
MSEKVEVKSGRDGRQNREQEAKKRGLITTFEGRTDGEVTGGDKPGRKRETYNEGSTQGERTDRLMNQTFFLFCCRLFLCEIFSTFGPHTSRV